MYGPKNALDYENVSTCWNSDGNMANNNNNNKASTSFIIEFGRIVQVREIRIQFQAGFVAEQIHVFTQSSDDCVKTEWKSIIELEADDDHELQSFPLLINEEESSSSSSSNVVNPSSSSCCTALKLEFDEFTDFYQRVTIYQLQVFGYEQATKTTTATELKEDGTSKTES